MGESPPRIPFSGSTTYQDEFVPKEGERSSFVPIERGVPRIPFEGVSTSHSDFTAKPLSPHAVSFLFALCGSFFLFFSQIALWRFAQFHTLLLFCFVVAW